MEYHCLSVDLWTCVTAAHIPFLSDLLGFLIVSQIIWQGHITDLGHFYDYSHILVVDSSTTNIN